MRRAWEVSGYRFADELGRDVNINAMSDYEKAKMGSIMEKLAGDDARMAWIHHGNNAEEPFPDEDNNVGWDVGKDEAAKQKAAQQQGSTATTVMPAANPGKKGAATKTKKKAVADKPKKKAAVAKPKKKAVAAKSKKRCNSSNKTKARGPSCRTITSRGWRSTLMTCWRKRTKGSNWND